jgi:hypothetical protein
MAMSIFFFYDAQTYVKSFYDDGLWMMDYELFFKLQNPQALTIMNQVLNFELSYLLRFTPKTLFSNPNYQDPGSRIQNPVSGINLVNYELRIILFR